MSLHNDQTTQELLGASASLIRPTDVEKASQCAALLDPMGRIAVVSAATVDAYGLDDQSQLVGRHWCKTWPSDAHRPLSVAIARAWRGEIATYWTNYPNEDVFPATGISAFVRFLMMQAM